MRISLRIVVILGLLLGLVIPISLATWLQIKSERHALENDAQLAHGRVTEVLALGVQKALWDLAPESASPLVASIMQDERMVSAKILDNKKESFHEEIKGERRIGQILTLEKPILNEGEQIGTVVTEFSMHSAEQKIAESLRKTLMSAAVQVTVCILILLGIMNARILRRVARIKNEAQMLAKNHSKHPSTGRQTMRLVNLA